MKILAQIETYHTSLANAIQVGDHTLTIRRGIYLIITSENGNQVKGEIAPLPGLHLETLEEALRQLEKILPQLNRLSLGSYHRIWEWINRLEALPSVRFGVETALLSLFATEQNLSLSKVLNPNALNDVSYNGLLPAEMTLLEKETYLRQLSGEGVSCVKIKAGRELLEADIEQINNVMAITPTKMLFRVDANQAWSIAETAMFASRVDMSRIEYIEEPLHNPEELLALSGIPIALDESLRVLSEEAIMSLKDVKAFVLKPMLLGGISSVMHWAKRAKDMGANVVISSCWESSVGIDALKEIAKAFQNPGVWAGLDTGRLM